MSKKILRLSEKKDKSILKEGTIGGLHYKIFNRGNIQLTEGDKVFRKDISALKDAISRMDFDKMKDHDEYKIPGAGDTDPLLIYRSSGEYKLALKSNVPPVVRDLLEIINTEE